MGEKITETAAWIEHKGKRILFSNYRGLNGEALVSQIRANNDTIAEIAEQGERDHLRLLDVTDCYATREVMAAFKDGAIMLSPYVRASAIVGVTRMEKHLLRIINQLASLSIRPFETIEEAKDWLVEQHDK